MNAQHTPGPWRWEFNRQSKTIALHGGKPKFDLTILEPCRWGMGGAGLELRDPSKDGLNLLCKVHERDDWVKAFPNRDHHKHWCATVDHPDMRLIEAAPDLLAIVKELVEIERRDSLTDPDQAATDAHRERSWEAARAAIAKATGEEA
jgi:hypothetical protein